jgi:hypothetical protein
MNQEKITVTENRTSFRIPKFEAIDVITAIALVIVGLLLLTDRPTPDFLIAIVGLGTGAKVYTQSQLEKAQEQKSPRDTYPQLP